ncbi:hypothetical protein [Candidatus Cyanaurora vandensis]|uniref:hypothetical protein n=1 Tax=Candidatus Cyanaurora vandensis TaxID=2714958 RepID=UPI002579F158|nr:hypothetical protein [Candidatus Cyanaurora vandensis]
MSLLTEIPLFEELFQEVMQERLLAAIEQAKAEIAQQMKAEVMQRLEAEQRAERLATRLR